MGRDSYSICRTCGEYQENGYGSYTTWMDHHTSLADFDADTEGGKYAHLGKNQNVRDFLARHQGHEIEWTSTDAWYYDDDDRILKGLTKRTAPHEFG